MPKCHGVFPLSQHVENKIQVNINWLSVIGTGREQNN